MTHSEFNTIVDNFTDRIKSVLKKKEAEYSLTEDRLDSFKKAASLQHCTPAQALAGMLTKHIVSIYDFIAEGKPITEDMALEKIGDASNYLILLYAVLKDMGFKDTCMIDGNTIACKPTEPTACKKINKRG